ncbi:MAG: tetratricopeptide repeat protein [Capsulimonadaceae bacterium]
MNVSEIQSVMEEAQGHLREGRSGDAEPLLRRVLDARPNEWEVRNTLANLLNVGGQYGEAARALGFNHAIDPADVQTHLAMAQAYDRSGNDARARFHYNEALRLDPHCAAAHQLRGFFLLKRGDVDPDDWRQGLADYEWGRAHHGGPCAIGFPRPTRSLQPQWDGRPIPGKRLYVAHEQGHGDAVMLWRFLPLVRERSRAQSIVVEAPTNLVRLLAQSEPECESIVAMRPQGAFATHFDEYAMDASLPHVLGVGVDDIPDRPYLRVDRADTADTRLSVGLCWKGSDGHPSDRQRSIPWEVLGRVRGVEGLRFACLQFGPAAEEAGFVPLEGDYLDTARAIAACDLVVTVDTSVAHIAGALGVPVWTLLALDNDWRWFRERGDTPWYGAMRLFRQTAPGDWEGVVTRVRAALAREAELRRGLEA